MKINEYIQMKIDEQGLKKNWLCDKADINYKSLKYKLDNDTFTVYEIFKLCNILGLDIKDLKYEYEEDLKMKNLKLFVAGYYDEREFKDDERIRAFDKNIDTYTLEEVLKLGFVENVIADYEENYKEDYGDKEWEELDYKDKVNFIVDYTESDELAKVYWFNTEEKAEEIKNEYLEELYQFEKEFKYSYQKQNEYGQFVEVWERI